MLLVVFFTEGEVVKKFLSILFLFVLFQNSYSFNLSSFFDSSKNEYAYLNELSEEEIVKEIVDNTYENEIGIISWIKNVISYVRKTKSEKVEEVVSKIIVWDKKLSEEQILENNINNIKKLVFKICYDVYKRMPSDSIVDMAKEEGIDLDLSLISDLESFVKYIEENSEEDIDEKEDWIDPLNNQNPLFYAFSIDNVVLSKVFLDKGIKVQDCLYDRGFYFNESGQKDFFDGPILPVIAGIGYNSFNLFLDNYCTDINAVILDDGDEDFRLIEFAVMNDYGDIVKKLLDKGAQNKRYEEEEGVLYHGALLTAVTFNNFDMVKLLVENGVDVNDYNEEGSTLSIAIESNYKDIAQYLINNGAYVEEQFIFFDCDDELKEYIINDLESKYNISPLHIASLLGQVDQVKELLDQGFDPNIKDIDDRTPLHVIIHNGSYIRSDSDCYSLYCESSIPFKDYIDILDLLIKYGADINEVDCNGNTSLIYSANFSLKFLDYLLKNGADIKIVNNNDFSALGFIAKDFYYASRYLDYKVLNSVKDNSFLDFAYYVSVFYGNDSRNDCFFPLNYGEYHKELITEVFDKNSLNNRYFKDGLNLLHVAVLNSNKFMTHYLIENGFDINSVDLEGKSVLFFAQNIFVAKRLLELGVDFKIKDFKGRTALDYAKELKYYEMVKFLESYSDSNIDELA